MKSTGIIRKVDELGRIVLPIELRRALEIEEKTELEIFVEGNTVVLQKAGQSCIFCDSMKGLTKFKGCNVCTSCFRELLKQKKE